MTKRIVIPAQAGIQIVKKVPRIAEQHVGFVRYAKILVLLDSRLRGNDTVL
ncbi:MAG: hypothetical protein GJU76_01375 [Gallionella sp.]|nr:hypothetical protein [Gallionella sp.]